MVPVHKYLLIGLALLPARGEIQFKVDDPLVHEPPPLNVEKPRSRSIDAFYDFVYQNFAAPRIYERDVLEGKIASAGDVNTLGEVMQGPWYTHRHYFDRMSPAELKSGPGNSTPPSFDGKWKVTAAKTDGVTPGFRIEDSKGHRYLLKFDPIGEPELASGADMMGSKIFYALGYYTPENYVVNFPIGQLTVDPKATYEDSQGRKVKLTMPYVARLLYGQPKDKEGRYRGLASRFVPGEPIGPFKYKSLRSDDPNDIVRHEDRRSLRGLRIFAAWLNHTDTKAMNTLDVVVEENGRRFVKHYLIDFGSTLGSDSLFEKEASRGNVYDVDLTEMGKQILSFGFRVHPWMRVSVPDLRGVGHFESQSFDPQTWTGNYPNPAFLRMDAQDAFWAARQVAAFTDADLRALTEVAEYTDPRSAAYIAQVLGERRDKIIQTYLNRPLRLDRFHVSGDMLQFEDLGRIYAGREASQEISWSTYENSTGKRYGIIGRGPRAPEGSLLVAHITEPDVREWVDVFVRRSEDGARVVGIERAY